MGLYANPYGWRVIIMTYAPKLIHEVHLSTQGHPRFGVSGEYAIIQAPVDALIDLSDVDPCDRKAVLDQFEAGLKQTLKFVWEEPASVVFDFQIDVD
jgi:hypothetical protein